MASLGSRFLLLVAIAILMARACDATRYRSSRYRSTRYRSTSYRSSSSSGTGSVSAGVTVGIIFGVIGFIVAAVAIFIMCKKYQARSSSASTPKAKNVVTPSTPYKAAFTVNPPYSVEPPPYTSAVNGDYNSQYTSDPAYPPNPPPPAVYGADYGSAFPAPAFPAPVEGNAGDKKDPVPATPTAFA